MILKFTCETARKMKNNGTGKKGQVTVFIIIAILIVAGIVAYFLIKDRVGLGSVPREVMPIYEYFLSCISDETKVAASIMGSQAGYLELPEFERGSEYMPFSSQLGFLGAAVPYWYYVSGNGIAKEQVPSKEKMEQQLEEYLKERIMECDFSQFEQQGFEVGVEEEPKVDVEIKEREIKVGVEMPLVMSFDEITARQTSHEVEASSRLGKFYDIARKIYDKESEELFLENYGVDVLRLYAPVDGSELGCSPKIWQVDDIKEDLITALEANVPAIKVKGDYYSLDEESNKYFIEDVGENIGGEGEYVNFMYLRDWPTRIEIWPGDDPLIAEPVGLQEGMGMLGFCYVPYHFIYDMGYPVLIQIYDAEEMFQFPVAVVIDKNKPREAENVEGLPDVVPELCEHKLTALDVYTYNSQLEPVEAQIKYKCFDTSCYIGDTQVVEGEAVLTAMFPQCVNGYIIARAEGYKTKKYIASSVREGSVAVVLDKKYKLELEVKKGGRELEEEYAIVSFVREDESVTVVYPEQKEVELTAGEYEIEVYVYTNSTINLEGSKTEKCVDVPKSGLLGIFGASEKKCFTLEVPDQVVSFAVSGGGKQNWYVVESRLEESSKIIIDAVDFGKPNKVEELQMNYKNIELNPLGVEFE